MGPGTLREVSEEMGKEEGSPEVMTQLLSLLMPRPERWEKRLIRRRAGEMVVTVKAARARSSAKAKTEMPGRTPRASRRGS